VEKKQFSFSYIVIFIVILGLLFLPQLFSSEVRIKILNIFRVPLKVSSGIFYVLRDVSRFKELRDENKILRDNLSSLKKEMLNLQEAGLENQRLKDLLGFRDKEKRKFIPAMVIARDPLGLHDTIIIDKGKRDEVSKDMVVISGNGLVGRVRECGWSISRVLLITDCDSVLSAIVQRTREEGAVIGTRSGIIMKYLELDSSVKEGDRVMTSGFGDVFEKGILIGEVSSIEKDSSSLYMKAMIKPEVDIARLEEVLVIR